MGITSKISSVASGTAPAAASERNKAYKKHQSEVLARGSVRAKLGSGCRTNPDRDEVLDEEQDEADEKQDLGRLVQQRDVSESTKEYSNRHILGDGLASGILRLSRKRVGS
eukprot:m.341648 g.341648  ORF g.341648 m.341648 type:complete len:111 (+) comp55772_c0_seq4:2075-2407(+)